MLDASYNLFVSDKLDALSGLRPKLMQEVEKLDGARILCQANALWCNSPLVVPRTRNQVQLFLREFVRG